MQPSTIYLSLGSNVGDRGANLRMAIAKLGDVGVRVRKTSAIYETQPVDFLEQRWFFNCVVEAETEREPLALLTALREIETAMGSKKLIAKGPRLIDIDLLFYGDQTIHTPELQVPHPRMAQRRFVLVPLADLAPDFRHPASGLTVSEMLKDTSDTSDVRKIMGQDVSV